jgi:carbon storage regulator
MLVFSRKQEQKFIIGSDIEITIIEVSGNRVRFGITAPKDIEIQKRYIPETETANAAVPTGLEGPKHGIAVAAGTSQSA